MRSFFVIGAACLLAASCRGAEEPKLTYVDLQPQANWKLTDGEGNSLSALPKGEQTLAGVKFKVGAGLIQLGSPTWPDMPERVEGLKVGTTCSKLYFLHACHRSAKADAIIGYYTVNYDDQSQETIPIVYGKDVSNWWYGPGEPGPTRAHIAWEGANDKAKNEGANIRLYLATWKNPEPKRKVVSIDFGSTSYTGTNPFCVAITAEK
jgi:hypothetical protein